MPNSINQNFDVDAVNEMAPELLECIFILQLSLHQVLVFTPTAGEGRGQRESRVYFS